MVSDDVFDRLRDQSGASDNGWTPLAGALVAGVEIWIVIAGGTHIWISLTLAVFGGTLAMIGPGAWSLDARLFGRKLIRS